MRGLDCNDQPTHADKHFSAVDDDELVHQVREHLVNSHPDVDPGQAKEIVAQGAYDE